MENTWSEHLSATGLGSFRTVCVSAASLPTVRADLETQGFMTYVLDSVGVDNKAALLAALADCFAITEYANHGLSSWDAASDVIWQVLMERPDKHIALMWNHADMMIANHLQLFLDGLEMLYALGSTLERQEATADTHPVLLRIVVFGEGRSFPRWQ
jgi:hypothetical protein